MVGSEMPNIIYVTFELKIVKLVNANRIYNFNVSPCIFQFNN